MIPELALMGTVAGAGIVFFILMLVMVRVIPIVLNCYFASKKNRSVVGWFFLGFFFSYLSTIIIAFLPLKEKREGR